MTEHPSVLVGSADGSGTSGSQQTSSLTTRMAGALASPYLRRSLTDVLALLVLFAVGVQSFGPVFGGAVGYSAAGAAVLAGLGIAALGAWRRLGPVTLLLTCTSAYLVIGTVVAVPDDAIAGVVPTLDGLERLGVLTWQSWRDLLTVALPAGDFTGPAAMPLLAGLLLATAGGSAALRLRRPVLAVIGGLGSALAFLAIAILWGSVEAPLALPQGLVFAGVALAWSSWRTSVGDPRNVAVLAPTGHEHSRRSTRVLLGAASLAVVAVLVTGLVAAVGTPGSRNVLRDHVRPPLDLSGTASPLTYYRDLSLGHKEDVLFTVTGLPEGSRIRLAAMDSYDGMTFRGDGRSAEFLRSGRVIPPTSYSRTDTPVRHLSFGIEEYAGIWLPGGGDLRGVRFTGADAEAHRLGLHYSAASGTALTTAPLVAGDTYEVDVADPPVLPSELPDDAAVATAPIGTVTQVKAVADQAVALAGDAVTPLAQAQAVAETLRREGFYSDGSPDHPSLPGHGAERLRQLFDHPTGQLIGDDEQYAAAMALVARELGLPARVVMGFYPDPESTRADEPLEITGDDAHVWVEVAFQDLGWVTFDPTPDEDKLPDDSVVRQEELSVPQVLPPPDVPEERDRKAPAPASSEQTDRDIEEPLIDLPGWARYVGYAVGGAGLLLLPFFLIAGLKAHRRHRRRTARRTADQVAGAWGELVDLLTDLGHDVPRSGTRVEVARSMSETTSGAVTEAMARLIDAHVFGPDEPTDHSARDVWGYVAGIRRKILRSVPVVHRLRTRFSLRSLTRSATSTARVRRPARRHGGRRVANAS